MKIRILLFFSLFCALEAQEQFPSIHQRESEFYRDNPALAGRTVVPAPLTKRSDLMKRQSLSGVVYGFHPYWQNGSESNYYFSLLTHVAYFSAEIDAATGNFTTTRSWSSASVVATAQSYGVKVHLSVTLFSGHATLLSSTAARNTLIQNALTQLALRNADGLNVDFESMSESVRDDFRTFMKQLGDSLQAHGYEFVIELPAVDWSSVSDGTGLFDATFFAAVNGVVDYYFLMAYDYYYKGSTTAGPIAPLMPTASTSIHHVLRSVNKYTGTGCPSAKLIAGFPYYGYDWQVTSSSPLAAVTTGTDGVARLYTSIKNDYTDTIPSDREYWHSTYNSRYYNYVLAGQWQQTWYDDSLSLGMKYDSIRTKGLAGTGMWALGYDGSETELWGALRNAFASSPDPLHTSLDAFESGAGHFTSIPTYSGTTTGISASSTAAVSNDAAHNGSQSMQIVLKNDASSPNNFSVRFLSGAGTAANNTAWPVTGYTGFWLNTVSSRSGLQTALCVDDGAGGTLISSKQNITADGTWRLYQWNLASTSWTILAGADNVLNGPTATLDAVMFYSANAPDSSDWTLYIDDVSHYSSGALPVELSRFAVRSSGTSVRLEWETASETDNYGFEVQRAKNKSLHTPWNEIGFVEGAGTSHSPRSYAFTDPAPEPGTQYYRLRQIDRNGAFRYSQEISLSVSPAVPEAFLLYQNFPNPFNPVTTIRYHLPEKSHVRLTVYDILGKEAAVLVNGVHEAGSQTVAFNASGLPSGIYFYMLSTNRYSAAKKMIFLK